MQRLFVTKKGRKRRREAEAVIEKFTAGVLDALPRKVWKHHVEFCEAVLATEGAAATSSSSGPARSALARAGR